MEFFKVTQDNVDGRADCDEHKGKTAAYGLELANFGPGIYLCKDCLKDLSRMLGLLRKELG